MLIILEGADGTGKSTLAEGLMPLLKGIKLVLNYSYPREKTKPECIAYARGEYEASMRVFKKFTDKMWIICDRFHIGEYAYGPVMRGYLQREASETLQRIEKSLLEELGGKMKIRLIVTSCDPELAWKRSREKADTYVTDPLTIEELILRYRHAFKLSKLPKLKLDTGKLNKQQCLLEAVEFIEGPVKALTYPRLNSGERLIG